MKCPHCKKEIGTETIIVDGWEYEKETTQFNTKFKDIKTPKGWVLWDYEDCIKLHNDKNLRKELNLEDCWFFIEQPFSLNKEEKLVARLVAYSDWADLYCDGSPDDRCVSLGVFLVRRIEK